MIQLKNMEENKKIETAQQNTKRLRRKRKRKTFTPNYTPNLPSEILNIKIEELELLPETKESLLAGRVLCIKDIASRYIHEMYSIQKIGKKQCFEIQKALKKYGADFRPAEIDQKHAVNYNNADRTINVDNGFKHNKNGRQVKFDRDIKLKTIRDGLQKPTPEPFEPLKNEYLKFSKGGKFGLKTIDKKDLIPAEYDDIFLFSADLAVVQIGEKYGYIDKNNNIKIQPKYDLALSFSDGLAVVAKCEKGQYMCGYIDVNDNIIIDFEYESATPFNAGMASVKKEGKWYNIDKQNKVIE